MEKLEERPGALFVVEASQELARRNSSLMPVFKEIPADHPHSLVSTHNVFSSLFLLSAEQKCQNTKLEGSKL